MPVAARRGRRARCRPGGVGGVKIGADRLEQLDCLRLHLRSDVAGRELRLLEELRQPGRVQGADVEVEEDAPEILERCIGLPSRHAECRERSLEPRVRGDHRNPCIGLGAQVVEGLAKHVGEGEPESGLEGQRVERLPPCSVGEVGGKPGESGGTEDDGDGKWSEPRRVPTGLRAALRHRQRDGKAAARVVVAAVDRRPHHHEDQKQGDREEEHRRAAVTLDQTLLALLEAVRALQVVDVEDADAAEQHEHDEKAENVSASS